MAHLTMYQLAHSAVLTKLASGDLLLYFRDKLQHPKLTTLIALGIVEVSVTPHRPMNSSNGVVSDDDLLNQSEEELLRGWNEQQVTNEQRNKTKRDNKGIPTKHLVITFSYSVLPGTTTSKSDLISLTHANVSTVRDMAMVR